MFKIKKYYRLLIFIIVLALSCSGCYYFLFQNQENTRNSEKKPDEPDWVPVTVINVSPGTYHGGITAHGQAEPEEKITLRSAAAGQVIWISNRFKKGQIVQKGEILARINPVAYQSRLAQAELSLSNARLNLLKEEQEARQASENWSRSGFAGAPDSELVLRKPQLANARKEIDYAIANVALAQSELAYCTIRSPARALITDRFISNGEWVSQTDKAAQLFGMDKAKIEFYLDPKDAAILHFEFQQNKIILYDDNTDISWPARLVTDGKRVLPDSRLRPFICEVDNPMNLNPPLLAGTFVRLKIIGKTRSDLLKLPQSCLTPKNRVWFTATTDNTLNRFKAETVFYRDGHVFVKAPENVSFPLQIALYPNQSFKKGRRIKAQFEKKKG